MLIILKPKHQSPSHPFLISFTLQCVTYCVEVWGKRKQSNKADYHKPTNTLFINSHALQFTEVIDLKIASLMYKPCNNTFPDGIQRLFQIRKKKKKKKLSISDLHYAFVWRKQNTTKTSIMRSRESGGEQVLMHGWAESKSEPRCYFPSWVCLFSCVYCSMSPWFVYVWNDALCLIASKTWEASVSCTLVHSSRPMHSFWDLSPDWKHQRPA